MIIILFMMWVGRVGHITELLKQSLQVVAVPVHFVMSIISTATALYHTVCAHAIEAPTTGHQVSHIIELSKMEGLN